MTLFRGVSYIGIHKWKIISSPHSYTLILFWQSLVISTVLESKTMKMKGLFREKSIQIEKTISPY